MTSITQLRLPRLLLLMTALAATADRAEAQSDPSPWRFGVTLGGGASVGVVAEYWNDDFGIEARLGTLAFEDVSVRLSPKWRVGSWDGGEASWRLGVQWFQIGGYRDVFVVVHAAELAAVTDGGHVVGGSYNLPLAFGGWGWEEMFPELSRDPDETTNAEDPEEGPDVATEDPEEDPDVVTEDPEIPSPWAIGTAASIAISFFLGEFTYRYQPGG